MALLLMKINYESNFSAAIGNWSLQCIARSNELHLNLVSIQGCGM